ncbi:unnamed protein product, partial [Chrysoparadoxa australica]
VRAAVIDAIAGAVEVQRSAGLSQTCLSRRSPLSIETGEDEINKGSQQGLELQEKNFTGVRLAKGAICTLQSGRRS